MSSLEDTQALEQAAQKGHAVSVPGVLQDPSGPSPGRPCLMLALLWPGSWTTDLLWSLQAQMPCHYCVANSGSVQKVILAVVKSSSLVPFFIRMYMRFFCLLFLFLFIFCFYF